MAPLVWVDAFQIVTAMYCGAVQRCSLQSCARGSAQGGREGDKGFCSVRQEPGTLALTAHARGFVQDMAADGVRDQGLRDRPTTVRCSYLSSFHRSLHPLETCSADMLLRDMAERSLESLGCGRRTTQARAQRRRMRCGPAARWSARSWITLRAGYHLLWLCSLLAWSSGTHRVRRADVLQRARGAAL